MKKNLIALLLAAPAIFLSGCEMESVYDEYDAWRVKNDEYLTTIDTEEFPPVSPDWAPRNTIYIKWHNDRSLTAGNLVPMSTSTVNCKYEMEDINGKSLGNSYKAATGDSVYQSQPNANITGFWAALTMMHVGDSVTVIIPYESAYGNQTRGSILPYSNLIYHIKLKEIVDFERPKD